MEKVICRDIKGCHHEVTVNDLAFRPSAYGIVIRDNQVLMTKHRDGYDFPGGGIELGESTEAALMREFKEETGLEIRVGRVIKCGNSFFKMPHNGDFYHCITMFFLCEIVGGELSLDHCDEHERSYIEMPEWIDVDHLDRIVIKNSVDSQALIKKALRIINQELI